MSEATPHLPASNPPTTNLPATTTAIVPVDPRRLTDEDLAALQRAVRALEHTNLATRVANALGKQLGSLQRMLPLGVGTLINRTAESAIRQGLSFAIRTLDRAPVRDSRRFHRALATLSGAAGGAFGLSSLGVELPVSTIIILRSIADIARREGEDLSDPAVALACLEVFALGAHEADETFTEGGYFAVRSLLARTVSEAGKYIVANGLGDQAAPVLVRFVGQIASRFGMVVSEKIAAQAVPVIGAAGGAAVNFAFAEHFQSLATGHFTVRRLERIYGGDVVRAHYRQLAEREQAAA